MSNMNFNWSFKLTDGTTQTISSTIEDIIFSGDDISDCLVNIKGNSTTNRFSADVSFPFFINKIFEDNGINTTAGNLVNGIVSNISTNFKNYSDADTSGVTNLDWVELASNSIINVTTSNSPQTDVFDIYPRKYTFVATGTTYGTFVLQIPQFQTDGTVTNTTYTLSNGDSITIYGQNIGNNFGYTVIDKQIGTNTGNIIVTGDLSVSGNSLTLPLNNIGIKFVFTSTGGGVYNCVVSTIGSTSISNVDLRRYSIWNGGSVETYTINNGIITSSGTNIDSSIYGDSQDVSTVLICVNSIVWKITYWSSYGASRARMMAERFFV